MIVPFPETSEEVRLLIVKLLDTIVTKYKFSFNSCMSETSTALAKI
jgi:hypothetical protein